eukprot:CAMPEP_0175354220 /NCGR_PEP_ID=MMETSP0095-20121207/12841_1 /TAXON_ID=311494 /ORGANISM="Alexandrium monilatum, Strain CCMP3105" /LENGTH=275 /DNA_ID=CAMNT_0016651853 /DNA_START=14 /DNA_END=841 /DNA_ORIENTATION=-
MTMARGKRSTQQGLLFAAEPARSVPNWPARAKTGHQGEWAASVLLVVNLLQHLLPVVDVPLLAVVPYGEVAENESAAGNVLKDKGQNLYHQERATGGVDYLRLAHAFAVDPFALHHPLVRTTHLELLHDIQENLHYAEADKAGQNEPREDRSGSVLPRLDGQVTVLLELEHPEAFQLGHHVAHKQHARTQQVQEDAKHLCVPRGRERDLCWVGVDPDQQPQAHGRDKLPEAGPVHCGSRDRLIAGVDVSQVERILADKDAHPSDHAECVEELSSW